MQRLGDAALTLFYKGRKAAAKWTPSVQSTGGGGESVETKQSKIHKTRRQIQAPWQLSIALQVDRGSGVDCPGAGQGQERKAGCETI